VADDLDLLGQLREAEADDRAPHIGEGELDLFGGHLVQRAVGRVLARHRAGVHAVEDAVDAQRVAAGPRRAVLLQPRDQRGVLQGRGKRRVGVGVEGDHHRERRVLGAVDAADRPVGGGLPRLPVHHHQLPVEVIEGAEALVAGAQQLGDGHVAVVGAVEQGGHGGRLDGAVGVRREVAVPAPGGVQVQGGDEGRVDAHAIRRPGRAGRRACRRAGRRRRRPRSSRPGGARAGAARRCAAARARSR